MTDRRRLAPLLLIAVGGAVLLGCIPFPGPYTNATGDRRPERKIGPAGSDAPIVLGRSDAARVVSVLGPPALATGDGRVLAFAYVVVDGYAVWPLCFGVTRGEVGLLLAARFDEDGVLSEYRVFKEKDRDAASQVGGGDASGGGLEVPARGGAAVNRLAICLVVATLCGGCLPTPVVFGPTAGVNAGRAVGPRGSWTRPLKVGTATRKDVTDRLGRPHAKAFNGREIAYSWSERRLLLLAIVPLVREERRTMTLRFDADDRLVALDRRVQPWDPLDLHGGPPPTRDEYPDPGFSPPRGSGDVGSWETYVPRHFRSRSAPVDPPEHGVISREINDDDADGEPER